MFRALVFVKNKVIFDEVKLKLKNEKSNIIHSTKTVNEATVNVSLYEYIEKNWLNCKEMWATMYRKHLNTIRSDTNNHIEAFHQQIQLGICMIVYLYDNSHFIIYIT